MSRLPGETVVTSTSSVRHYGVQCNSFYDWVKDDGQRTWIDGYDGIKRVKRVSSFEAMLFFAFVH